MKNYSMHDYLKEKYPNIGSKNKPNHTKNLNDPKVLAPKQIKSFTKEQIWKEFYLKSVKPTLFLIILFIIFQYILAKYEIYDYRYILLLCGFVFGITKIFIFFIPSLDPISIISNIVLYFAVGIIIGVFVLVFQIARAIWYIPLTAYRFILMLL